jgi:hypothetical protein
MLESGRIECRSGTAQAVGGEMKRWRMKRRMSDLIPKNGVERGEVCCS